MLSSVQPLATPCMANWCINCTSPMAPSAAECVYCGHARADDARLLGSSSSTQVWEQLRALPVCGGGDEAGLLPLPLRRPPAAGGSNSDQTTGAAAAAAATGGSSSGSVEGGIQGGPGAGAGAGTRPGRVALPGSVALAVDERMLEHRSSLPPYPERPERLRAIMARLGAAGVTQRCMRVASREATDEELMRVHTRELVDAVAGVRSTAALDPGALPAAPGDGGGDGGGGAGGEGAGGAHSSAGVTASLLPVLDPGMLLTARSDVCARLAAGAAIDAVLAVARGHADSALALVRPPGNSASPGVISGGCVFNNAAVAARAAQAVGVGVSRVMVVDWDVHYGHGTQETFDGDASVLYVSMHRTDEEFYPRDIPGNVDVIGTGPGEGFTVNLAWAEEGVTDGDALAATTHVLLPLAHSFAPDLLIISAGFGAAAGDAHGGDCHLSPAAYAHMTALLKSVAPTVMLLEGGTNLEQTARCVEACAHVLLGERPPPLPAGAAAATTPGGWVAIMNALQVHGAGAWPALRHLSWAGWSDVIRQQQDSMRAAEEGEEGEEGVADADAEATSSEEPSGSGYW
ncbi:hypothetical protein FOA52_011311 [Chlamydomonas sp. UWO 241]|nr:hypothetical protein FOA52_011311 [Chlamydomonas sp. UWO 241]